jgi:hypothetical protein
MISIAQFQHIDSHFAGFSSWRPEFHPRQSISRNIILQTDDDWSSLGMISCKCQENNETETTDICKLMADLTCPTFTVKPGLSTVRIKVMIYCL